MLSYAAAVAQLYELGHELAKLPAHKFDLAQMRVLLAALGDPQRRFRSVLIAGTNGKGSTAATLAAIVQAAGYRTGLYTSPHLLRINQRIRLNGSDIPDPDFACLYDRVEREARRLLAAGELPWHPSFFEMLTAMAFLYFAEAVDIAVLEVGMGGRLDATNAVDPLIAVITDISLDHQKYLGNTIREIAREKAGIIRPGGLVVTLPQHPEANEVIGNTILDCHAEAVSAVEYVPPCHPERAQQAKDPGKCHSERAPRAKDPGERPAPEPRSGEELSADASIRIRYPLEVTGQQITVESPLAGRHQWRNLALAIAAAVQLNRFGIHVSPGDIQSGIRATRWPGRFEIIPADLRRGTPEMVLDVAHNPAGAWALRAALSERYADRPLLFVFGVMRDKAMREIAEILFPLAQRVIVTRADNPRAATAEEIRSAARGICTNIDTASTVAAAVERARSLAGLNGVIVITGSIYIVGEALAALPPRAQAGNV